MSFEGYYQQICVNGHFTTRQLDDLEDDCIYCYEEMVWENLVDLTNGSKDENGNRIDGYIDLEESTPAVWCECICGNRHTHTHKTYKVPKCQK